MKTVLLFDFDGTLVDSMKTLVAIYNELADEYSLPKKIKTEDIPMLRKRNLHELIQEFHIPSIKIPFLLFAGRKKFADHASSLHPITGVRQTLMNLKKQGVILGVVTSNTKANVETFLKKNDMEVFDFIYSEKGIFGKDKVLRHAIEQYNLPYEDTLYVGDELRDIEAARKAGIKIISVTWGANTREALEKSHPDYIIDKPSELLLLNNN